MAEAVGTKDIATENRASAELPLWLNENFPRHLSLSSRLDPISVRPNRCSEKPMVDEFAFTDLPFWLNGYAKLPNSRNERCPGVAQALRIRMR